MACHLHVLSGHGEFNRESSMSTNDFRGLFFSVQVGGGKF